jgi:hypothetical protein
MKNVIMEFASQGAPVVTRKILFATKMIKYYVNLILLALQKLIIAQQVLYAL